MARALDLSRQSVASLAQVPRDVIRHVERDAEPYALSLAQNRLASLSDIHVFRHVVQLDVSGNQLQSLEGIDALAQLESLNASRNSLVALDALAPLAQLRVLHVAENRLTQLDTLRQLKSLVAVDASYNSIAKWPQLTQLTKLESIDLSSNQLEAFPVGVAARMFPPSLQRLSLVKNQIQELCGIAALGLFLPTLQTIQVDNNPATQRVLRDGGCLDFLWVNLFANVAFAQGSGVHRDDFVVPAEIVEAVEDAVERGDEAVLSQFLLTGTVATRLSSSAAHYPPPPLYHHQTVVPREDASLTAISNSRVKMNELSRPLTSETPPPVQAVTGGADGLSKESKMEMWKRMMDERKLQEQRDRAPIATTPKPPAPAPPPPPAPAVVSKPMPAPKPDTKIRAPDGPPPSSVARREPSSAATATSSSPPVDALLGQVKTLHEQLSGMRKYVNVWIKREQLTRVAAAKRIQRNFRHRQWMRRLSALVDHSRVRRQDEFGVTPSSSTRLALHLVPASQRHLHLYAMIIQRQVRGWLTRFHVSRFLYYSDAAVRIQRVWRRRRSQRLAVKRELGLVKPVKGRHASLIVPLVNTVAALACDVRQLQRVFVVQEHVLARQWRELTHYKRLVEAAWLPSVVKLQSLWRGYLVRREVHVPSRPRQLGPARKNSRSQDAEIAALRAELDALKQVVGRLVEKNES